MTQAVLDKPAAATFPCFTEEHDMIRETVKKFARNEIAPHSADWDEAESFPRELFKQGAELGLFGIRIDPEWAAAVLIGGPPPRT